MARFKRLEVLNTMVESGVVPLFYSPDVDLVKEIVKACYLGGARVFEFTNRGDYAHEVFGELNKWAAKECPELILGVGSIVDPGTTSLYIQLGANFIVSPSFNPDMAKVCNRRKVAWLPGCGTLSEINAAEELGCEIVKIFPGKEVGGPAFVKSIKGPCPWTNIMPSGGVAPEPENLKSWFDAGATCVGLGSQLFPKEIIAKKDFAFVTNKLKEVIAYVNEIR